MACAGVYLLAYRPWSVPGGDAIGVYAGSAAMLVLAIVPPKVRVGHALLIALAVPTLIFLLQNVILNVL